MMSFIRIPECTFDFNRKDWKGYKKERQIVDAKWQAILRRPGFRALWCRGVSLTPGTKGSAWQLTYWSGEKALSDRQLDSLDEAFEELRGYTGRSVTVLWD